MRQFIFILSILFVQSLFAQETKTKDVDKKVDHKEIKRIKKELITIDSELMSLNMKQNSTVDKMIEHGDEPEKVVKLSAEAKETKTKIKEKEAEKKQLQKELAIMSKEEHDEENGQNGEWRSALGWDNFVFKRHRSKFYGHWAGIELGINGFLSENNSLTPEPGNEFMELELIKSWTIAANVLEFNLPIVKPNFGITTGLGLEWNHYRFVQPFHFGQENEKITTENLTQNITKNQLNTFQLNVPLIFEVQFPASAKNRFHLGVGPMVSYVFSTEQELAWKTDLQEIEKSHNNGMLINKFRYGATARLGFSYFHLYANYSLVPLFEKDKGPVAYPFSVGIVLLNF